MDLLKRPEIKYADILKIKPSDIDVSEAVSEQIEIQTKYDGYISRQQEEIDRSKRNENTKLPIDFEYGTVSGLSNEMKQKLFNVKPESIAQASRIPGITPAAIALILVYLKKRNMSKSVEQAS